MVAGEGANPRKLDCGFGRHGREPTGDGAAIIAGAAVVLGLLGWCLAGSSPALANMGAPWTDGDAPGELSGIADIRVESEELEFDISGMAGGRIPVRAIYHLENPGVPITGQLVFVSPFMASVTATLDGAALPAKLEEDAPVPEGYAPPAFSPPLPPWDQPDGLPIEYPPSLSRKEGPTCDLVRLDATIPPGRHELVVRYGLTPPTHEVGSLYRAYQVPYVLAPARTWAAFGTLKISVLLPSGWEAASSLPLTRVPEGLSGTFSGLPADTFAVTARPVLAPWRESVRGSMPLLGVALALLLSTLLGLVRGRSLGAAGASGRRALLVALWVGFLAAVLAVLTMLFALWLGNLVVESEHLGNSASYRTMMAGLVLVPAAMFAAVLSSLLMLHVARRRALAGNASRQAQTH